ncbi:MAG: glutamine--fructose-6-phosphate transaminase (isomerizing) [Candidatus Pacebacteria bacterium]|nr:glutamine--fructose-6-phosphate transaminase (isomerizing) [Candidatus Paceibacterota bacterium]
MCGITAMIGKSTSTHVPQQLLLALKRLGYRGYDGAGIAYLADDTLRRIRNPDKTGKGIAKVTSSVLAMQCESSRGIAHTRWATHGQVNEVNTHPHFSADNSIAIVHNGTLENITELESILNRKGISLASECDTELLAQLIMLERRTHNTLAEAVRAALAYVRGSYGIAVLSNDPSDPLVIARHGSPLCIGYKKGTSRTLYAASDEIALVGLADEIQYLAEGEMATLSADGSVDIHGLDAEVVQGRFTPVSLTEEDIGFGGYPHRMLLEINQQRDVITDCLRGRIRTDGSVELGAFRIPRERFPGSIVEAFQRASLLTIAAHGTSYIAGCYGARFMENVALLPTRVLLASEYHHADHLTKPGDIVVGISQSGTTTDTLLALEEAAQRGAHTFGVTNRIGSDIARFVEAGVYVYAGPENAVASTKAFSAQVAALYLVALRVAQLRGSCSHEEIAKRTAELSTLPSLVQKVLQDTVSLQSFVECVPLPKRCFVLGRGYAHPLALETTLKLKEVAYIDAHAEHLTELKHGPLALVEEGTPVIAFLPEDGLADKSAIALIEAATRGATLFVVGTQLPAALVGKVRAFFQVPRTSPELFGIVAAPVAQFLAYGLGVRQGIDVDHPRNIAKSVTV